jgi:hypothetical protein
LNPAVCPVLQIDLQLREAGCSGQCRRERIRNYLLDVVSALPHPWLNVQNAKLDIC